MRFFKLVILCIVWLAPAVALADVAVFPVQATNLTEGQGEAIRTLLTGAYQVESGKGAVQGGQADAALEEAGSAKAAAAQLNAEEYLLVSAVRLKKKIIISASRYSRDGKVIHTAKMTAASFDDLEPVVERLAKALVTGKNTKETQTLDNVTEREGQKKNRTFVEKVMGIKSGVSFPFSHESDLQIEPLLYFGFDGRLEGETYFFEVGAGFAVPGVSEVDDEETVGMGGLYGEIGGSVYLTHTFVSPYVGGGFIPRIWAPSGGNVAAYLQGGLMFMRQSSSRLYLDVRVAQSLMPMNFSWYDPLLVTDEQRKAYPTEVIIGVGAGW